MMSKYRNTEHFLTEHFSGKYCINWCDREQMWCFCCPRVLHKPPFSLLVQTVVLMSDLATVLDAQGRYEEAHTYSRRAAELARATQHPEEHMVLNNLAAILMHKGQ